MKYNFVWQVITLSAMPVQRTVCVLPYLVNIAQKLQLHNTPILIGFHRTCDITVLCRDQLCAVIYMSTWLVIGSLGRLALYRLSRNSEDLMEWGQVQMTSCFCSTWMLSARVLTNLSTVLTAVCVMQCWFYLFIAPFFKKNLWTVTMRNIGNKVLFSQQGRVD